MHHHAALENFRLEAHHFMPSPLVAASSAVAAMAGGVIAAVDANQLPAWIGLATVASAVVTATVGGLGTWFKAWLDYRGREEQARWERHDVANKLNLAKLEITSLKDENRRLSDDIGRLNSEVAENRHVIEKLRNGRGPATATGSGE